MANRVTMKDVALKAEVSLATVSKVINNDRTVGAHKARSVWDAVRALDRKLRNTVKLRQKFRKYKFFIQKMN